MWQVVVLTLSLVVTANSYSSRQQRSYSAASEAQIRFANENKYDDTGPRAKGREFAYKTYGTLEEALINYLDDPNTTLPEHEREKALSYLKLQNTNVYSSPKRPPPNTGGEYNAYTKQAIPVLPLSSPTKQTFLDSVNSYGLLDLPGFQLNDIPPSYQKETVNDGYSYQKIQSLKGVPVSVAHYTRGFQGHDQKAPRDDQFDPNPQYSFSYGVHDKRTGDTKSAQETRADGIVRGFYSFLDADGRQRTVHYTADDKQGFQAKVQRTLRDAAQKTTGNAEQNPHKII